MIEQEGNELVGGTLAVVREDGTGGYSVVDSRDGEQISWRRDLSAANDLAQYVNSTYPDRLIAPARDSLRFETMVYWIVGGPVLPLSAALVVRRVSEVFPDYPPAGMGWE
jgi:hypothetical protein